MKDRPCLGQLEAYLLRHRERPDLHLRRLERPQPMVDLAATDDAPLASAVQAVALRQKVLDGAPAALEGFSCRTVTGLELGGRGASVRADAPVVNLVVCT